MIFLRKEILWGGQAIEGDHEAILLNIVASTIQKWRTFKLLRWLQILQQWKLDLEMYADRSSTDEQVLVMQSF